MAGEEGFEPPNAGTRTQCLTTWRLPINLINYSVQEGSSLTNLVLGQIFVPPCHPTLPYRMIRYHLAAPQYWRIMNRGNYNNLLRSTQPRKPTSHKRLLLSLAVVVAE